MADGERRTRRINTPAMKRLARAIPREAPAKRERMKRGKKKNREARVKKRMAQIGGT